MRILFIYFYLRLKDLNIYYIFKYIYINYQVSQNPKYIRTNEVYTGNMTWEYSLTINSSQENVYKPSDVIFFIHFYLSTILKIYIYFCLSNLKNEKMIIIYAQTFLKTLNLLYSICNIVK